MSCSKLGTAAHLAARVIEEPGDTLHNQWRLAQGGWGGSGGWSQGNDYQGKGQAGAYKGSSSTWKGASTGSWKGAATNGWKGDSTSSNGWKGDSSSSFKGWKPEASTGWKGDSSSSWGWKGDSKGKGSDDWSWSSWGTGKGSGTFAKGKFGGKGIKGKGKGLEWVCEGGGVGAGFEGGKRGPGHKLPRTRVTENPVLGEVLEWKGKYGWIRPSEQVQHAQADRREGKIFVSQQDLVGTSVPASDGRLYMSTGVSAGLIAQRWMRLPGSADALLSCIFHLSTFGELRGKGQGHGRDPTKGSKAKDMACSGLKVLCKETATHDTAARQLGKTCKKDACPAACNIRVERMLISCGGALSELFTTEYVDTLMILAKASSKLVAVQPVLTEARVPCRIFGDIHGQLRDLLLIFAAFGFPGSKEDNLNDLEMSYVFNGDFVDRGAHSLEVIGLLLALKVSMPDRVWLVRGNHEDRSMNARYGFWEECHDRLGDTFGRKTYDLFQTTFDQLPIACLVANKILCVHGGVGDGRWDLNDLRAVRRPLSQQELCSAKLRWVHNILWSDPIEDDREQRSQEAGPVFGVHESPRNTTAVLFGWDVTKTFCAKNGISMVVRSHQSKKDGIGVDVMHDNMLIRVFSARDYEGHGNDGAVLLVQPTDEGDAQCCDRPEQIMVRAQVLGSFAKATANASRGALYRLNVSQDTGR
ncbi:BSU1 [Symbiodinium sp. KB8]|nr:BSU1 [Symbiodinium sp. KB8]